MYSHVALLAEWLALSANKTSGLHRTNEDKRRAVLLAFEHPNGKESSNSIIAEWCGVSHTFVNKLRSEVETVSTLRQGKDGKQYSIKPSSTAKILPEVRLLITGLELFDNPQELKALAFLVVAMTLIRLIPLNQSLVNKLTHL